MTSEMILRLTLASVTGVLPSWCVADSHYLVAAPIVMPCPGVSLPGGRGNQPGSAAKQDRAKSGALAARDEPDVTILVLRRLLKGEVAVRRAAVNVLSADDVYDPRFGKLFSEALHDEDLHVRTRAIGGLAKYRAEARAALVKMISFLRTASVGERWAALSVITSLGTDGAEAADAVRECVTNSSGEIRREAMKVAVAIAGRDVRTIRLVCDVLVGSQDREERWHAARALEACDRMTADLLRALGIALKDEYDAVRVLSANIVGKHGPSCASLVNEVMAGTEHANAQVREASIRALARLGLQTPDILRRLEAGLRDKDRKVASSAAWQLPQVGSAGRQLSLRYVIEGSHDVRVLCAYNLGEEKLRGKEALAVLRRALHDESPLARIGALVSIGKHGKAASVALDDLKQCLLDPEPRVQKAALKALGEVLELDRTAD